MRLLSIVCTAILVLGAAAGVVAFRLQSTQRDAHPAAAMFRFVREHARPGEVYLIPASLQEFRLATGAPALVDRKTIPYLDTDVVEWNDRLRLADWFYREEPEDVNCALIDRLAEQYGVTHLVLDEDLLDLACPQSREVYRDSHYAVHALSGP